MSNESTLYLILKYNKHKFVYQLYLNLVNGVWKMDKLLSPPLPDVESVNMFEVKDTRKWDTMYIREKED